MISYFSAYAPNQDAVTLEVKCYDVHIRVEKYGCDLPSVFEIKRAVESPIDIRQSQRDPDSRIYVGEAGHIGRTYWYTVVVAELDGPQKLFVSTAYNAIRYTQKGPQLWARGGAS